jgi:cation/acetate symporter
LAIGLLGSLVLIVIGPSIMGPQATAYIHRSAPIFPLANPGIVSVPLGFLGAWLGTMLGKHEEEAERKFTELEVRANVGLGAEKAAAAGH